MTDVDVRTSTRAGYAIIALHGDLDICTAEGAVCALAAAVASGSQIIVDLTDLAFMDCSGLAALIAARAAARRAGGDLLLAALQPAVLRLLSLTGQIDLLPVYASVDQAASGTGTAPAAR